MVSLLIPIKGSSNFRVYLWGVRKSHGSLSQNNTTKFQAFREVAQFLMMRDVSVGNWSPGRVSGDAHSEGGRNVGLALRCRTQQGPPDPPDPPGTRSQRGFRGWAKAVSSH